MRCVALLNETRGVALAGEAEVADGPLERSVGLLGRRGLEQGGGLLIPGCGAVHTLFMRFPIDLLFLDRDGVVRGIRHRLAPFRFAACVGSRLSVAELPAGTLAATGTQAGDRVVIKPRGGSLG